jgi:predicted nucleotidyltransferase
LVALTPEGRIVLTLKHGKHTYSELKFETGLSDRWLAMKLRELEGEKRVEKSGRWYGLGGDLMISSYELSLYMDFQAGRMAGELAKLGCVEAVLLFGSVAQRRALEPSDLDVIIVVGESIGEAKKKVMPEVSRLEFMYHSTIEPLILTRDDFLDNVYSREGGIVYGLAEGYEILFDRTGELARILRERVEEIRSSHDYLEEGRIWLRVR